MTKDYDLKPEDQLLLNCSLTNASEDNIKKINHLIALDLDWNYLIDLAYRHRLNTLLYWHLNKICPESIPLNLKRELQENFQKNVTRNLLMFKELINVLNIIQEYGITPIPYKGPVLAIMTYKNLGLRKFADLDFYVPLEDVPRTKDILVENGYEPLIKLTNEQEMTFFKYQREYLFINKSNNITLEIKWKFLSTLFPMNEPFLSDPKALIDVDLDQFKVKTLSPEPLILILSIHNANHSFSSLYRFCDLSELIKSEDQIRWHNILERAEELEVKRIFMVNLYLLRELFEIKIPEDISEEIDSDEAIQKLSKRIMVWLFSDKQSKGTMERFFFLFLQVSLRERMITKLKTVLNLIFSPTPEAIESISLPKIFEPFYYFVKFFLMLKNIITNYQ